MISPDCIEAVDIESPAIVLDLSKWRVAAAPEATADLALHRQYERELARYGKWIPHWQAIGAPVPIGASPNGFDEDADTDLTTPLLSLHEVSQ